MGDAGSQASYGSQTIAPADFALKPAQFRAVFKGINIADSALFGNDQGRHVYVKSFFRA